MMRITSRYRSAKTTKSKRLVEDPMMKKTRLVIRMFSVLTFQYVRVIEDLGRLAKAHTVLLQIGRGLLIVSLEFHLSASSSYLSRQPRGINTEYSRPQFEWLLSTIPV